MNKILICSDLDRTILPNGPQPASELAFTLLQRLAARKEVVLTYVSGRNKELLKQAVQEYDIPVPRYAIGDVGTTIYEPMCDWQPWHDWDEEIEGDWQGKTRQDLQDMLGDFDEIKLQEQEKQNKHKLSYYADPDLDAGTLTAKIRNKLEDDKIETSIIWSVDEEKNVGLLDILPKRATKVHAIRFLMRKKGFQENRTVFAGDSGNDLPALTSGLRAILVKNAREDVRKEALNTMRDQNLEERLYLAKGDFLDMNGNYCAGVLEGVVHFLPETLAWMSPEEGV